MQLYRLKDLQLNRGSLGGVREGLKNRRVPRDILHLKDRAVAQLQERKNAETIGFLELLNGARSVWAARDREKLRGESADVILAAVAEE